MKAFDRYAPMSFELDKKTLTHLKDKSSYNQNYYQINFSSYGDYILREKCSVIYEHCNDDEFGAYYSLGWFEGDKFVAAWTWYNEECLHLGTILTT
jgi:hypothetical protein